MKLARGGLVPPLFFGRNGQGLHLRPRVHEPLREQGFRDRNTPGACSGRRKSRKTWVPKRRAGEACAEPLVFARATQRDEISKRGSCAPSVFWSKRSGFTLAFSSTRTTSGARVPSPGHAGGLFRTTEKQKNMRAERASRRVMRGALGFSRGQRGGGRRTN